MFVLGKSVSFCKGEGSLNHNNRKFFAKNVDPERTHLNVIYKQESLSDAYDKLFGEELTRYNASQKRADRKIPDYIEHIRNSKNGEKLFYENVIQVGTMHSCPAQSEDGKKAAKILDEYMRDFEKRNPNLYVFNAVMHMDEATPHIHVDWIPVARGYQNGLQVRNSLDKALKQQGVDGKNNKTENRTQAWQARERNCLIEVMERNGWEYEPSLDTERGNLTIDQYKAMVEEIKKEVETLPAQIQKQNIPLSKDKVLVSTDELEHLERRAALSTVHEEATEAIKEKATDKANEYIDYVNVQLTKLQAAQEEERRKIELEREKVRRQRENAESEEAHAYYLIKEAEGKVHEVEVEKKKCLNLQTRLDSLDGDYKNLIRGYNALKAENTSLKAQIEAVRAETADKIEEAVKSFRERSESLAEALRGAFEDLTNIVKAYGKLKYRGDDPDYHIDDLSDRQGKLIDGIADYGAAQARKAGFPDLAEDMEEHVDISKDIKAFVEPKVVTKKKDFREL